MQGFTSFVPILVMFGIFYFILIRPQVRKQKEHQAMLQKLGKGDRVLTRGGIIGTISGVSEDNQLVTEDLDEGDFRRNGPRFTGENLKANLELAGKVAEIADEKGTLSFLKIPTVASLLGKK